MLFDWFCSISSMNYSSISLFNSSFSSSLVLFFLPIPPFTIFICLGRNRDLALHGLYSRYYCLRSSGGAGISFSKLFFKCLSMRIELLSRSKRTNCAPSFRMFVSTASETSSEMSLVVIDATIGNGDWKIMLSTLFLSQLRMTVCEYLNGVINPIRDKAQKVLMVGLLLTRITVFSQSIAVRISRNQSQAMLENSIPEAKAAWASLELQLLIKVPMILLPKAYTSEGMGFLFMQDFRISVTEFGSEKALVLNSNPKYWNLSFPYFNCFTRWRTRALHNSTIHRIWESKNGQQLLIANIFSTIQMSPYPALRPLNDTISGSFKHRIYICLFTLDYDSSFLELSLQSRLPRRLKTKYPSLKEQLGIHSNTSLTCPSYFFPFTLRPSISSGKALRSISLFLFSAVTFFVFLSHQKRRLGLSFMLLEVGFFYWNIPMSLTSGPITRKSYARVVPAFFSMTLDSIDSWVLPTISFSRNTSFLILIGSITYSYLVRFCTGGYILLYFRAPLPCNLGLQLSFGYFFGPILWFPCSLKRFLSPSNSMIITCRSCLSCMFYLTQLSNLNSLSFKIN